MQAITNAQLLGVQSVLSEIICFFEPECAAGSEFVAIKKILQKCGVQSPEYLAAILIDNGVRVKR